MRDNLRPHTLTRFMIQAARAASAELNAGHGHLKRKQWQMAQKLYTR
jgi:hypothetical protein